MPDLTTLTDDQIRVKAAEAMGYHKGKIAWMSPDGEYGLPDPLHDPNDAVALAEAKCECWSLAAGRDVDGKRQFTADVLMPKPQWKVAKWVHAEAAEALTLAVLTAMDSQEPPDA